MNKNQLDHAESLLRIEFPHPYRRFMESLPDHGGTVCWEELIGLQIINHPELLAVNNLELRESGPIFAGARWPKHYLAIGDDGCGNTYCLDVGNNPSSALLMYDHDPAHAFIAAEPSYADFFKVLMSYEPQLDDDDFYRRTEKGLIVTRAPEPWKSILHPISLDEWSAYLGIDRALKYLGYREQTNPFTQEALRMDWPGYAVWEQADGPAVPIEYRFGRLTMKGQGARCVETMTRVARVLNARLFGPDGAELVVH